MIKEQKKGENDGLNNATLWIVKEGRVLLSAFPRITESRTVETWCLSWIGLYEMMQVKRHSVLLSPDMETSGTFMFAICTPSVIRRGWKLTLTLIKWRKSSCSGYASPTRLPGVILVLNMDKNERWKVENIHFHKNHPWTYGQSIWESIELFCSLPSSMKRISKSNSLIRNVFFPCTLPQIVCLLLSCSYAHVRVFLTVMPSLLWCWPPPTRLKCEAISQEIALDMKAKTSPPLQNEQKKKGRRKKRCWSEYLCSEHYGNGPPDADTLPMGLALWIVWSHLHSSRLWYTARLFTLLLRACTSLRMWMALVAALWNEGSLSTCETWL